MRKNGSVPRGFDFLRVALAILVVVYHAANVTRGPSVPLGWAWLIGDSIVPCFFVVSGFLIAASAGRRSMPEFLANRFLRIVPAFAVTIAVTALVIGPVFTNLPLGEYFSAPAFREYFLNLVGGLPTGLPGVFQGLPNSGMVNLSLWSIRWEFGCYLLIAAAAAAGALKRPRIMIGLCLAIMLIPSALEVARFGYHLLRPAAELAPVRPNGAYFRHPVEAELGSYDDIVVQVYVFFAGWYFRVVTFFAAGVVAYVLRGRIPYSPKAAFLGLAAVPLISAAIPEGFSVALSNLLLLAPLSYFVLVAGVSDVRPPAPFSSGDYSYGIYLFAFPVQQIVHLSGVDFGYWPLNALASLPIITGLAMLSWHLLERPILSRRTALANRFSLARALPRSVPQDVAPVNA